MSPSDAEFNSASDGDIFTHGKTIGDILSEFFHSIRRKIKISVRFFPNRFPVSKNITIRCRIEFCIGWIHFYGRELFLYKIVYDSLFRGASSMVLASHRWYLTNLTNGLER